MRRGHDEGDDRIARDSHGHRTVAAAMIAPPCSSPSTIIRIGPEGYVPGWRPVHGPPADIPVPSSRCEKVCGERVRAQAAGRTVSGRQRWRYERWGQRLSSGVVLSLRHVVRGSKSGV